MLASQRSTHLKPTATTTAAAAVKGLRAEKCVMYQKEIAQSKQNKEVEKEEENNAHRITFNQFNQNQFITKNRSRLPILLYQKSPERRKSPKTRKELVPPNMHSRIHTSFTQRRTDPSDAWRSEPTRPCPPRRGRTPSSNRYWRG